MREIKFRAWLGGRFSYWGFIPSPHGMGFCGIPSTNVEPLSIEEMQSRSQQYTGLHDKNGKEIYEGDIVKSNRGKEGPIQYLQGAFVFSDEYSDEVLAFLNLDRLEVIGNCFENGDLLNDSKLPKGN